MVTDDWEHAFCAVLLSLHLSLHISLSLSLSLLISLACSFSLFLSPSLCLPRSFFRILARTEG